MKKETVNHPEHYKGKKLEVIDIIDDYNLSFSLGNVIKYVLRAGKKEDAVEDLEKARWYLNREIDDLEDQIEQSTPVKEKPITLVDFLGWEEGVSYDVGIYDGGIHRVKDGRLEQSIGGGQWVNARLSLTPVEINKLRQAKKVESKCCYAKIKGWELVTNANRIYWNRSDYCNSVFVNDISEPEGFTIKLTKSEWNKLGINDTNADFEEVEE